MQKAHAPAQGKASSGGREKPKERHLKRASRPAPGSPSVSRQIKGENALGGKNKNSKGRRKSELLRRHRDQPPIGKKKNRTPRKESHLYRRRSAQFGSRIRARTRYSKDKMSSRRHAAKGGSRSKEKRRRGRYEAIPLAEKKSHRPLDVWKS